MARSAAQPTIEEDEEIGFVDLCDPEIEYYEPMPRRARPASVWRTASHRGSRPSKLELIVNEQPLHRSAYNGAGSEGVDLQVFGTDPENPTLDIDLADEETVDQPRAAKDLEEEALEAVLVDDATVSEELTTPMLPEPTERVGLAAHQAAVAGSPQDCVQAYFLESFSEAEAAAAPQQAAAILKARHDLYMMESLRLDDQALAEFRDACLGELLAAMPSGETPKLHGAWRAALKLLSELFDEGEGF